VHLQKELCGEGERLLFRSCTNNGGKAAGTAAAGSSCGSFANRRRWGSTREGAIHHSLKHGDERISRQWMVDIREALLPALRLEQRT